MKKKMVSVLLAMLLLAALPPAATADYGGFRDVDAGAYYASAVVWAVERGITYGTGDDLFSPDTICTRGQVVTFLWRAKGEPEPQTKTNPFADVATGSYCEKAVLWAVEQGITNGTSESPKLFSPDTPCTYAQIITFLWRANGCPEPAFVSSMTEDWADSLYYKKAVTWGDNNALFEDEGGVFDPETPCTRARTVAWLYRDAVVYVSDVRHLVDAIGPGREIYLDPGVYDLTEWAKSVTQGMPWSTGNPYVRLQSVVDGWEVQIVGVSQLSIGSASGNSADVSLTVSPRYADVLTFVDCSGVRLNGLTLGHTPEQGFCLGAVLDLQNCGHVYLSDLDLYGCGTYGITAEGAEYLSVSDSVIHDCSYGIMTLERVKEAAFSAVTCRDCRGFTSIEVTQSSVGFYGCEFLGNSWDRYAGFIATDAASTVRFDTCAFSPAAYEFIVGYEYYGGTVFVEDETVL